MKEILVQPDSEGKRGIWITKLLEYDLVIKPTTLIKGHGISKMLVESNCKALGMHYIFSQSDGSVSQDEERSLQVMEKYISSS